MLTMLRDWREAFGHFEKLLEIQRSEGCCTNSGTISQFASDTNSRACCRITLVPHLPAGRMGTMPTSLVRVICQALTHADIEQCRLVCKDWRAGFGEASVTDLYMVRVPWCLTQHET